MEPGDFLKVIYFDEPFVSDFLQIIAGGELKKTSEFLSELHSESEAEAAVDAKVGTDTKGVAKLFSIFSGMDLSASGKAGAEISHKRDRIVKNILENTLLSDFVSILKADARRTKNKRCKGIKTFDKITVRPVKNSFSYFMLIAPYMAMMDGKVDLDGSQLKIDPAKLEQALDKGRGFYEFIGVSKGEKFVIRFNRQAFRNGYTMSDLPKMELTYYAIKVGQISLDELDVNKEFEFGAKIPERLDYKRQNETEVADVIDVYDAVIAGVLQ